LGERKGFFTKAVELARFLAIVNVAMADAGLAAWEAKYHYFYPRPVTGIRGATPTTSPLKARMEFWTPLGAPVSNAQRERVNFTPPFPSYPSGHATFGGALFQVFRGVFGTDEVKFTFISDEYNGLNRDAGAPAPRDRRPVTFDNFKRAEFDNARSRIFLGIHWQFDGTEGIKQGNQVATFVLDNLYKPRGF
jgi:hypothetical protein